MVGGQVPLFGDFRGVIPPRCVTRLRSWNRKTIFAKNRVRRLKLTQNRLLFHVLKDETSNLNVSLAKAV